MQHINATNEFHNNDRGSPTNANAPLRIMLGSIANIHNNSPVINYVGSQSSSSPNSSPFSSPMTNTILTGHNNTITSTLNPNIDSPIIMPRIHSLSNSSDDSPYQSQYQYQQQLFSQSSNAIDQTSYGQHQSMYSSSYHLHSNNSSSASMDLEPVGSSGCMPCSLFSFLFGSRSGGGSRKDKLVVNNPQRGVSIPAIRSLDANVTLYAAPI